LTVGKSSSHSQVGSRRSDQFKLSAQRSAQTKASCPGTAALDGVRAVQRRLYAMDQAVSHSPNQSDQARRNEHPRWSSRVVARGGARQTGWDEHPAWPGRQTDSATSPLQIVVRSADATFSSARLFPRRRQNLPPPQHQAQTLHLRPPCPLWLHRVSSPDDPQDCQHPAS
jgi:hypothetical protein